MIQFEKPHENFAFKQTNRSLPRQLLPSLFLALLWMAPAWGLDPAKQISQYAHTAWRVADGAFDGSPVVLAQTTDGYLWIGTNIGLVRFDGVRFTSWNPPAGQHLLDPRIFSLLGARDGSLWIGTGFGISHFKDGVLVNFPQISGRIESIVEDSENTIWFVRNQTTDSIGPTCRIKNEQVRCYGTADGIPFPLAIHIANNTSGGLWIGGYSELLRWKPGSTETFFSNGAPRPETFASLRALASASDGSAWAAIDSPGTFLHLEHFEHGVWNTRNFPLVHIGNSEVSTLFVDRDNTLWIGTAHHGVIRARGDQISRFENMDGLSSDAVGSFFQDAEGTVWVVTSEGIDNFRDELVTSYSMREGLSAAGASSVLAARDGTVWVGNFQAVDLIRDGKVSSIKKAQSFPGSNVTTIFEDHAGRLWIGIDSGLWFYERGEFHPVRRSDGSPMGIVFAITEDVQHTIWVRAGPNLARIHDLTFQDETTSPQISTAYTMAADPRGGVYLGLVNGSLVHYENGRTQTFETNEVGNARQIRDLLVESDGSVWGTTLDEVARWKNGVRKNLTTRNGLPCDEIFALVKDNRESLWLYSGCGLFSIEKSQLDAWWEHPESVVQYKLFDAFDGVQSGLTSLKPQATRASDGRLWFVNGHLLQMMDPARQRQNLLPPPVRIEAIIADRKTYPPDSGIRLPALTRDLEIEYTALSFMAPQKVRFRYLLEGRDHSWQEPGTRRQAFYNDLRPGSYRFRVMACNNDGVWNGAGAALEFVVAPAWFQTGWFLIICGLSLLTIIWALYQMRVRQIANAISVRFDERLAERTRMARELHDTFLQTIQGSKMVADDALDPNTDPARMRRALDQLAVWLGQAVEEGRAALNSLRTSTIEKNDLAGALERATQNGLVPSSMEATFSLVGDAKEMHPIVRDEIYRIGYEAIRNAYAHSQGSRLEVELRYAHELTLRVSDNGIGIDSPVAERGKPGHFGLQGMRERAARIRGKLTLQSSATSGTQITLVVPGKIVFQTTTTKSLRD